MTTPRAVADSVLVGVLAVRWKVNGGSRCTWCTVAIPSEERIATLRFDRSASWRDRLVQERPPHGTRLQAPAPELRSASELGPHHCDDPAHAAAGDHGADVRLSVARGGQDTAHRQPGATVGGPAADQLVGTPARWGPYDYGGEQNRAAFPAPRRLVNGAATVASRGVPTPPSPLAPRIGPATTRTASNARPSRLRSPTPRRATCSPSPRAFVLDALGAFTGNTITFHMTR